jgi:hypothetical protein
MKISELKVHDEDRFKELANSYGTVFNTLEWTSLFGKNICRYGLFHDNGQLIGGLSLFREKKYGISIYRNPPCTPSIGPFLQMDARNPTTIMDTWKEALSLMADAFDILPYSIVSCSMNIDVVDTQPFIWKKFKVVPNYTYLIDLNYSFEDLWQRISKVRKNEIKKTKSDGLVARQTEDFTVVKNLVLKTFSRQNKDINEYYLDRILFDFANRGNSYAFVTYMEDKPVAGTFIVYHNNVAHALLGGYDHKQKHRGAGPLADWECIIYAKQMGLRYFDFEGSMIPLVEKYMRGFGGILTPYYTINKAKLPLEILLKFIRRERF